MRNWSRGCVILLSLLLSACYVQIPEVGHIPLRSTAAQGLSSTDIVWGAGQDQLYIFVDEAYRSQINAAFLEHGTYGGGTAGPVAALTTAAIGDVRTQKATAALAPLQSAIADFKYDEGLQENLKSSLKQMPWLHVRNMRVIEDTDSESISKTLAASDSAAVLFVFPDYRLSNDGEMLIVQLLVRLAPNNDALRAIKPGNPGKGMFLPRESALYGNLFAFYTKVPPTGDRDRNIAEWAAQDGAAMRTAMSLAAKKLSLMIAQDIQRSESDLAPAPDAPTVTGALPPVSGWWALTQNGVAEGTWQGVLVGEDADGKTLRFRDGSLAYFTKAAFEIDSRHY